MNKAELIERIAVEAGISKAQATKALNAIIEAISKSLADGDPVSLAGFGSFYVGDRAARTGRNPSTGEAITIRASKVPKFRAGASLKEAVDTLKEAGDTLRILRSPTGGGGPGNKG